MLQVPIAVGSVLTTCVKTRYEHLAYETLAEKIILPIIYFIHA